MAARTSGPLSHPSRRSAAVAAAVVLAALALAGCAGSSSSSSGASTAPEAVASAGGVAGKVGVSADGTTSGAAAPLAVVADRSIVVRADLTVLVPDVARSTTELATVAARHSAVVASQTTSSGTEPSPLPYPTTPDGSLTCPATGCPTPYASSTTVLRVDNAAADALIRDVSALGTTLAATRTTDDVTADVADVEARVSNAEASLARIRALMTRATSIGDVVALEGELSKREADLEALQARQRALADQTAQATVTVRLVDDGAPVPAPSRTGFLAGLAAGWDSLTGALAVLLTAVGALVPWLIVIVPLGLLVGYVVRRLRRAPAAVTPTGTDDLPA
jgi:hypothetical protein